MKILHFDKERYLGILEIENRQYVAKYPFDNMSLINKEFDFDKNVKEYKKIKDIYKKLKMEFHTCSLSKMHELITKSKSNSILNLTSELIVNKKIKSTLSDLSQGRIYMLDLKDIETINLAIGIPPYAIREISNSIKLIDSDAESAFSKTMSINGGMWKEEVPELLNFIEKELIPEGRLEEADKTLAFLLADSGLNHSPTTQEKMNNLMNETKEQLTKDAINRGDSFAKPWQKYSNSEPSYYKKNKNNNKKKR